MNQPASADALDANAFEDEFSESSDGADGTDGADGASFDSDGFEGEASAGDEDFAGDAMGGGDDWDAASGDDQMAASDQDGFDADWQAFEAEVADALDEDDSDAFLGRLLGGLSRVARGAGQAARSAGARGLGQAAQGLAQTLGSQGAGGGTLGGIASMLGQLMAQKADDFEAFDELADAYEEGADEALPAIVGLAARGLARGLGHRTVSQLGQAARRALVRGVATAARTLVNQHGPRGARAIGHLAHRAGHAARHGARNTQHAVQRAARGLPRVAQRVAQRAGAVARLARPLAGRGVRGRAWAPAARGVRHPGGIAGPGSPLTRSAGYGDPSGGYYGAHPRVLRFNGPVEITIRQR